MQSITWKRFQSGTSCDGLLAPAARSALGAYAAEYRRAMLTARQVQRMAGHLDQAALLINQDRTPTDR